MKTSAKAFNRAGLSVRSLKWAAMLLLGILQLTASAQTYVYVPPKITLSYEGQGTAEVWSYYGDYKDNSGSRGTIRRLVATPAEHWKFKEWQLVSGDGEIQGEVTNATAYYKFGDEDAQIKAVFHQTLDKVEVMLGSGKAEVDANIPNRVYVEPDEGYTVGQVDWICENDDGTNSSVELVRISTQDGKSYYEAPNVYGNIEVYFTSIERTNDVRVTFIMKNHGTSPDIQDLTFSDGTELRVTKPATDPTDETYTFKGWFTDSRCTQPYDFNTVLSKDMLKYDYLLQIYRLNLYAKWVKTNNTIHFMPNFSKWDGMGEMPDVVVNIEETPTYTIPACTFVNEKGKKCIGWATSAIGKIQYFIGDKITVTDDMRLYAKWETISGTCGVVDANAGLTGEEVTWAISQGPTHEFDVLTISGTGTMRAKNPWKHVKQTTKSIVIEEGVENIGQEAFYGFINVTQPITIPASVTKIGDSAFYNIANKKKNPGISISTATGSQLEEIGKQAFKCANASIDLSSATKLETIPSQKLSIFNSVTKDITLPSSITLIEATNKKGTKTSFDGFKGDHVYYPLPKDKWLSVNNTVIESNETPDGRKVDLIGRLFDDPNKKRGNSYGLSLALMDNTESKTITTVGPFAAYGYGTDGTEISEARPGERVVLSWDSEGVEAGKYISNFTFKVDGVATNGVTARANDDNDDYSFIMPFGDVEVSSVQSPQEEYLLDLTKNTQVVIPESMYVLLNTLEGYYRPINDPNTGKFLYYIDLNRDGTPDLELTEPFYEDPAYEEEEEPADDEEDEDEDEDDDEVEEIPGDGGEYDYYEEEDESAGGSPADDEDEDPFKYEYSVKVLDGAQLVKTNCRFDLIYTPFPYRYNSVLVKLSNDFEPKDMERIDMLDDVYDNSYNIAEWAGDGKTHNLQLEDRLLYKDGDWNTLCLPCDVTISGSELDGTGVEARTLSSASIENKVLTLNFGDPVTKLQAGVPYIIKWDKAPHLYEPMFPAVTIPDLSAYGDENILYHERVAAWLADKGYDNKGQNSDERVRFLGTVEEIRFTEKNTSILFLGANNTLYYPQPGLAKPDKAWDPDDNPMLYPTIGAFRAYFKIGDDGEQARQIDGFNINFGNEDTGIGHTEITEITERAGAWYSLDGVRLQVKPTKKGLYIHGGKKVVVP